jgi:hypothetical protein
MKPGGVGLGEHSKKLVVDDRIPYSADRRPGYRTVLSSGLEP